MNALGIQTNDHHHLTDDHR